MCLKTTSVEFYTAVHSQKQLLPFGFAEMLHLKSAPGHSLDKIAL